VPPWPSSVAQTLKRDPSAAVEIAKGSPRVPGEAYEWITAFVEASLTASSMSASAPCVAPDLYDFAAGDADGLGRGRIRRVRRWRSGDRAAIQGRVVIDTRHTPRLLAGLAITAARRGALRSS
jgi:hypothetical protein